MKKWLSNKENLVAVTVLKIIAIVIAFLAIIKSYTDTVRTTSHSKSNCKDFSWLPVQSSIIVLN